jgi:hypothetical protein
MHRRPGDRHLVRADAVDEDELEFASDQIERVFGALAALAREGDAVLERPLRLAEDVRFDQELDREGGITATTLVLDEGTCPEVELDADAADALIELGAGATLDDAVATVSRREQLSSRDAESLRRDVRRLARDLLEQGIVELA